MEEQTEKLQEMFNKELEDLQNKQSWTYNNWNEKYTRKNQ